MSHYIIIREYKHTDSSQVTEVVRNAYLSNVKSSFYNALTREITFQIIVMSAAIMFIFFGVPILYCLLSIPLAMILIYICIYSSFYIKAAEVMQSKRPLQCWVAESCRPFFSLTDPKNVFYRIIGEKHLMTEGIEVGNLQRKIVGTVSVMNFTLSDDTAWLFRLAVDESYRQKGIGNVLVETVKGWSRTRNYVSVMLAISECQESARGLFITTGFQMKQMYHKQIIGSVITLLMYQLECDLRKPNF